MCQKATDKRIEVGMVTIRRSQQQFLKSVHRQIIVNFQVKLQVLKQLLQRLCQVTNTHRKTTESYLLDLTLIIQTADTQSGPIAQREPLNVLIMIACINY